MAYLQHVRAGEKFSRHVAFDCIPNTIGILRQIFRFVSMGELPAQLEWVIDDISELLAVANASKFLTLTIRRVKEAIPSSIL